MGRLSLFVGWVLMWRAGAKVATMQIPCVEMERLEKLTNGFQVVTTDEELSNTPMTNNKRVYVVTGNELSQQLLTNRHLPMQFPDFLVEDLRELGLMDVPFRLLVADYGGPPLPKPVLIKTRSKDDKQSVLYPIQKERFYPIEVFEKMSEADIPFEKKKNAIVWRGTETGFGGGRPNYTRLWAIQMFGDSKNRQIDIGLSAVDKRPAKQFEDCEKYVKGPMDWKEQLSYKYLLSLEGNDVATGLKWQLFSNSVVFMPEPEIESWFLETTLVPYVHYVPIFQNLTNLESQIRWADQHPAICKHIATNSTEYARDLYERTMTRRHERKLLLELAFGRKQVTCDPAEDVSVLKRPRLRTVVFQSTTSSSSH